MFHLNSFAKCNTFYDSVYILVLEFTSVFLYTCVRASEFLKAMYILLYVRHGEKCSYFRASFPDKDIETKKTKKKYKNTKNVDVRRCNAVADLLAGLMCVPNE